MIFNINKSGQALQFEIAILVRKGRVGFQRGYQVISSGCSTPYLLLFIYLYLFLGVAFIFNQKFFKDLYSDTGIDLENIVYYKDDTHYFVMTAKKHSLIDKGVILQVCF